MSKKNQNKKIISLFVSVMMIFGLFVVPVSAATTITADSNWTAGEPITTTAQFVQFASNVKTGTDYSGMTITLGADLDFNSATINPVGDASKAFKGTFDGQNHVIKNLKVESYTDDTNGCVGLFAKLEGATVKNLGIENITVSMNSSKITGNYYVGGIAGDARSGAKIDSCYVRNITLSDFNKSGARFGGLVGYIRKTGVVISNCYVQNLKSGTNLSATGTIAAGLVGCIHNDTTDTNNITISNCYAGNNAIGSTVKYTVGAIGEENNKLCTATNVYYDTNETAVGYWKSKSGTMVSVSDLKGNTGSVSLGSSFLTTSNNYNNGYPILSWEKTMYDNYSKTAWYYDNTSADTFTLSTTDEFIAFGEVVTSGVNFSGKTVKLANDLDFNSATINPVGDASKAFKGTFDGQNHVIKNLKVESYTDDTNGCVGLFAKLEGATVKNLGIENITVSMNSSKITGNYYVGGIAGDARSGAKIDSCYVRNITLSDFNKSGARFGGLVGYIRKTGVVISNCYVQNLKSGTNLSATGTIAAGLVGCIHNDTTDTNNITISNCYAGNNAIGSTVKYTVGAIGEENNKLCTATNVYYDTNETAVGYWKSKSGTMVSVSDLKGNTGSVSLGSSFLTTNDNYNYGYPVLSWETVPAVDVAAEVTKVSSVKKSDTDMATGIQIEVTPGTYTVNGIGWTIKNAENKKAKFNTSFGTAVSGRGSVSAALFISGLYIDGFTTGSVAVAPISGTVEESIATIE